MNSVNLAEKLRLFQDHWHPRIVGALNGQHVKLVKVLGEFAWHHHDEEDELFLVLAGTLIIRFRNREETIQAGEFIIVPRGVEHQPYAPTEAHILLFEPATTINTGSTTDTRTRHRLEWI